MIWVLSAAWLFLRGVLICELPFMLSALAHSLACCIQLSGHLSSMASLFAL